MTDVSFGVDTTAGCHALVGATSRYNADIVNIVSGVRHLVVEESS